MDIVAFGEEGAPLVLPALSDMKGAKREDNVRLNLNERRALFSVSVYNSHVGDE